MPQYVKSTALAVGDVIQDLYRISDNHPYLVIIKNTYTLTLRNFTSRDVDHLDTIKVAKDEKTGDGTWVGQDSYLVTSGSMLTLDRMEITGQQQVGSEVVEMQVGPPTQVTFLGTDGQIYYNWVVPTQMMTMPILVDVFSDISYRRIGKVKSEKMTSILEDLG